MALALVLNSGSSSIKFQLVDPANHATDDPFVSGLVEQIGEKMGRIILKIEGEKVVKEAPIADHSEGLSMSFDLMTEHGCGPSQVDIIAVGHRVVHGGILFSAPELITDEIVEMIRDLIPLAPLHNPANIDGIEVARRILPDVPHVAVFDTGFFHSLPPAAALYAINKDVAAEYGVRRYGFHGTSHEYVSSRVVDLMDKPIEEINTITFHLGNGASMAAVQGGVAVDTSMGMTPLAGLVMGTRTGDIDPTIYIHLHRQAGFGPEEIDDILNKRSGMMGMCGMNDFRDITAAVEAGDEAATLAMDVYVHRLRKYLGSYSFVLGGLDVIAFTAGIGENVPMVREKLLTGLERFGIELDLEANAARSKEMRVISTPESEVTVMIVPTDEELSIARQASEVARQLAG